MLTCECGWTGTVSQCSRFNNRLICPDCRSWIVVDVEAMAAENAVIALEMVARAMEGKR